MKLFVYIIVCAFLFALLDWKVIQFTRLANREWLDWMHTHERQYAAITRTTEYILCAPALALKPLFYIAAVSSEASQENQDSILHAPKPNLSGFYHLPRRGESWTFVNWIWWFLYWIPISVLWWMGIQWARNMINQL
jgi:hypothetical protein